MTRVWLAVICLCALTCCAVAQPTSEFVPDAATRGLWHFNEGTGTIAHDTSANGLNGTVTGAAWVTGRFGSGLNFSGSHSNCAISLNGTTGYGSVPDHPSLHFGSGNFTIEAMVWMDNAGTTYDLPVVNKGRSSTDAYYSLSIYLTTRRPLFGGSHANVEWNVTSPDPISLNAWHHLAGVRNGNTYTLYVDGVQKGQQTLTVGSTDNTAPLYIGNWPFSSPNRFFPGDIDEVRVWNVARTATQIAAAASTQLTGTESGLVGLWNFNACAGSVIQDRTATGNNGTLSGGYTYINATWSGGNSGDRVDLGSSMLLQPSILTCEAWVKADSIRTNDMLIVTNAKDFLGYALFLRNGSPAFDCQNGVRHIALSPDAITTGVWYHLAGTFDGSVARIWVNGDLKASIAASLAPQTNYPLMVGTDVTPPYVSDPFRGAIDEVRISNILRYDSSCGFTVDSHTRLYADFHEGSGTVVHDLSPNGLNGNVIGSPTWITGPCGSAMDFNGGGDGINFGSSNLLRPSVLTVDAMVRADSIRAGQMLIVTSAKDFHGYALSLWANGNPTFEVQNNGTRYQAIAPAPIVVGQWHHLAGTFDGTHVAVYVDGECQATVTGSLSPATYPLLVATDVTPPYVSDPFWGAIDNLRISDNVRYTCSLCDLSVVGPGAGDEWRVGQYGAGVEWSAGANCTGTVRVDLYRSGQFYRNISPCVAIHRDTLSWNVPCDVTMGTDYQIYVESCEDAGVHNLGNAFRIRENYPPESLHVVITSQYPDIHLLWNPVTTDTLGNPLCPHVYLVFFESNANEGMDFLAYTSDTSYVHHGVLQFSASHFYDVEIYLGSVESLQGALGALGPRISRQQLVDYLNLSPPAFGRAR